jgi:PAS domain-containing protein
MDMRESLSVRTVTALRRLAALEEKGKTLTEPKSSVLKTALRELEGALEELRVASEQLNELVDQMAEVRTDAAKVEARYTEFRNVLPIACICTDRDGQITDANTAAGELLNVAPRHLLGKPLSLYMIDRDRFFSMLNGVRLARERVRGDLGIRPRERKPRAMAAQLTQAEDEFFWFFSEHPATPGVPV